MIHRLSRQRLLLLALLSIAAYIFHSSSISFFQNLQRLPPEVPEHSHEQLSWDVSGYGSAEKSKWRFTGWKGVTSGERKRLLITGGAGQLGQAIIPRLLDTYEIHILDLPPRPTTLPISSNLLYHRGSILPTSSALSSLLYRTSFDGIIHLASVSLDSWCTPKESECEKVNVGGTKAVLEQIRNLANQADSSEDKWFRQSAKKVPWLLFGSGIDVYGHGSGTVDELTERKPVTALGRTRLAAEQAIEAAYAIRDDPSTPGSIILRSPQIYGYPHDRAIPERFIPSLLADTLTSLTVQYNSDAPPEALLHVDDAVDGVVRAIAKLEEGFQGVESFNLVSGRGWAQEELVDLVRAQTDSKSPLRDIGDHKSTLAATTYSSSKAETDLGWSASISLPIGLRQSLESLTSGIAEYSRAYLAANCPASPSNPIPGKPPINPADQRNQQLAKLNGCTVNIAFDHLGYLHHIKCEDGKHCTADGNKVSGYNWNQTVWIVRQVGSSGSGGRTMRVMFEQENGMGYLGYRKGVREGEVGLELFKNDTIEPDLVFDVEVQPDASNMRLLRPGTKQQLHAMSNVTTQSTFFALDNVGTSPLENHYDMRMTVLCCSSEGDWPLLLDDYESADIRYGSTGQIPFNASRRLHLCQRAEKAVEYNTARLSASDNVPAKLNALPIRWANKDLPVCWNDCDSPTVCVQTGDCRCVQADSCPPRRENPILTLNKPKHIPLKDDKSHLGAFKSFSPVLAQRVAVTDWRDVLLPSAREAIAAHPELIKVHVADGYPDQERIESASCHKLQPTHCFSADSILYRAMRHISVPADQADLVVLPVYQHCTGADFLLHDVAHFASTTIPGVREKTKSVGVVMTHDWGICIAFAWEIWSARQDHMLYPDSILDNMLVWSVMGDYDSPCYRPHQDVVIPARTCQSYRLFDAFPDVLSIRPARERPKLLTWSGTYWGTGKNSRLRLTCDRGGVGEKELIPGGGAQSRFLSWDYMSDLSSARFCPQPRGIAGWSPRTNDAIYAGCIPVLIAEGSHYPFASSLDWSKFSVRIHPTELDRIEQILGAIPLERVEEMQANLIVVREAFLYSTDEEPEKELGRMGPMYWSLVEAGMRLRTKYPVG